MANISILALSLNATLTVRGACMYNLETQVVLNDGIVNDL